MYRGQFIVHPRRVQRFFTPVEPKPRRWGKFWVWKGRPLRDNLLYTVKRLLRENDVETGKDMLQPLMYRKMLNSPDISNMLIEMFGKNGCLYEARLVFDATPEKRCQTWYFIIQAYTICGVLDEARRLYNEMPRIRRYMNPLFSVTHNLLLGAYVDNNRVEDAKCLFDEEFPPSEAAWGMMFRAYVKNELLEEAKLLFEKAKPKKESVAWISMITTYAENGYLREAKETLHAMPDRTPLAHSVLVIAFARAGYVKEAHQIFREAPVVDEEAWNVMTTAFAQKGCHREAKCLFQLTPHRPNQVTCIAMMLSYARQRDVTTAERIYLTTQVTTVALRNALLTVYAINGLPELAYNVFRQTEDRNVVTWSNMVYAYIVGGMLPEAKALMKRMPFRHPVSFNAMATVFALQGQPRKAIHLYRRRRNAISASIMVLAFAKVNKKFPAFEVMNLEGTSPDEFTFTSLLTACRHLGLWKEAREHFVSMVVDFDVVPGFEHYLCMIEALAYNGKLDEAEELARVMPFVDDLSTTATLVAAFKKGGNAQRAKRLMRPLGREERRSCDLLKGPLVTPEQLLDSTLLLSYMQDELVIRKRYQSSVRYLDYLSIPHDPKRSAVLVTTFA